MANRYCKALEERRQSSRRSGIPSEERYLEEKSREERHQWGREEQVRLGEETEPTGTGTLRP